MACVVQHSSQRVTIHNIVAGVVLIAISLLMGNSLFFGDFTLFNLIFDGLGLYFIGRGGFELMGQRTE